MVLSPFVGVQDTPAKPPEPPVVRMVVPLGIRPGVSTKLTIRGQRLEEVSGVTLSAPGSQVKIIEKGKTGVPNGQNAARVGDSQIIVEVTVPENLGRPPLAIVIQAATGETQVHPILSEAPFASAENEPNDGFRQAQALPVPGAVDGVIERNQDVDVYSVQGRAGQQFWFEVRASRQGSALDGSVSLFDARGNLVSSADDTTAGSDPVLKATLPSDGVFFVVVSDALDQGGPGHPYRLIIKPVGASQPNQPGSIP